MVAAQLDTFDADEVTFGLPSREGNLYVGVLLERDALSSGVEYLGSTCNRAPAVVRNTRALPRRVVGAERHLLRVAVPLAGLVRPVLGIRRCRGSHLVGTVRPVGPAGVRRPFARRLLGPLDVRRQLAARWLGGRRLGLPALGPIDR